MTPLKLIISQTSRPVTALITLDQQGGGGGGRPVEDTPLGGSTPPAAVARLINVW